VACDRGDEVARVAIHGPRETDELHHVEPPFAGLQAAMRASIGRAHISIDFPVPPPVLPSTPAPKQVPTTKPTGGRKPKVPGPGRGAEVSVADLLGAGLLSAGRSW